MVGIVLCPASAGINGSNRWAKMAKIATTIYYLDIDGDYGTVEGVEVTCDRCGHFEQSSGTDESSLRRCACLLRENCPRGENNFYEIDS